MLTTVKILKIMINITKILKNIKENYENQEKKMLTILHMKTMLKATITMLKIMLKIAMLDQKNMKNNKRLCQK